MNSLDYKKYPTISGIYLIKNTKNSKVYIGSAVNLRLRLQRHYYELSKNIHSNVHLQRSFNKNGKNAFKVQILEMYSSIQYKELLSIEEYYIHKFDAIKNGYNQMLNNSSFFKQLNKQKKHIQKNRTKNSKKVLAFDRFTGKLTYEFESITRASIFFNTSTSNISRCCKGHFNYIKGFVFCYKDDYDANREYKFPEHWAKNKKMSQEHKVNLTKKIQKIRGKKVYQYSLEKNLVTVYNSRREAELKNNFKPEYLRYKVGKQTPFEGYYWLYNKIEDIV